MAMRTSILLVAAMVAIAAYSQTPPPIEWQHTYGGSSADVGFSITATSDGGYIACSSTQSNDCDVAGLHGGMDHWVTKLDALGNLEWARCYGGTNGEMIDRQILESPVGGYILAGNSLSTDGDVTCADTTGQKLWLVRIAADGEIIWDRCPAGLPTNSFRAIANAHNGGWIVAGSTWSDGGTNCGLGQTDAWLAHIGVDGQTLWSRCYGGTLADGAGDIATTGDGGYIVVGSTRSNDGDLTGVNPYWVPPLPSSTGWVLKLDAVGEIQWQHCYGGSANDGFSSVVEAADGSFWLVGHTRSNDGDVTGNHGEEDGWVIRLDSNGEFLGQRCVGGSAEERTPGLALLPNGHALIAGDTYSMDGDITEPRGLSDAWILELDLALDIIWQRSYGGTAHDRCLDVHVSGASAAVFLVGTTRSNDGDLTNHPGNGEGDTWIMKTRPMDRHRCGRPGRGAGHPSLSEPDNRRSATGPRAIARPRRAIGDRGCIGARGACHTERTRHARGASQ